MSDEHITKLIYKIAELERKMANMFRPATVKEVKGDKMRMVIGKGSDGQDVLGPWMDTMNHRGGSSERRAYKEGQNLMLLCPNGDLAQAVATPFSANKDNKTPDHANTSGTDEETWQMDTLRVKKNKDGYAIWLQDKPDQQGDQQQGAEGAEAGGETGGSGGGESDTGSAGATGEAGSGDTVTKPPEHKQQTPEAKGSAFQISKDGGITGRVGSDIRFAVHKDGAKMKAGSNYSVVTKDKVILKAGAGDLHVSASGNLTSNKPWTTGDAPSDPIADDDKLAESSSGSGGGSGGGSSS